MGWRARALIGGAFLSAVGDQLAAFAFVLYAVSVRSSGLLAAILVVELVPGVLLSLVGGVVTDRYARAWWWPGVLLVQAGVFAALGAVGSPVPMVVLVGASAALSAAIGSVGPVVLRGVTGEAAWAVAARRTAAWGGFATVLGTVFGGVAFAATDRGFLMLIDAATFVVLAAVAPVVLAAGSVGPSTVARLRRRVGEASGRVVGFRGHVRDAAVGFGRLTGPDVLGRVRFAVLPVVMAGTSLEGVVGAFYLREWLSPGLFGLVNACWAAGIIAGASARVREPRDVFGWAAVAMGVGLAAPTLWHPRPAWALPAVAFVVGGVGNGLFNAALGAVIMGRVPGAEQGRAWGAFRVTSSASVLVGYLVGAVAGVAYAKPMMLISGLLPLIAGLACIGKLSEDSRSRLPTGVDRGSVG